MGGSAWSGQAYDNLKKTYATQSTSQIFSKNKLDKSMDPNGVKFRESRDSDVHPNSHAIMLFLDVTGSMGKIPERLIREKLGSLMTTLITHGVPDAHVFFGAIGDHHTDSTPLQVGQFEAGTKELDECLTKIYLESGGGGQAMESYLLAWLFAGRHTSIDCFEKRQEKGFLFTVGDEWTHPELRPEAIEKILGYKPEAALTAEQLLSEAQRLYHVFHLHIQEGTYRDSPNILGSWKQLLGERLILVEDYNNVAEIIASTVAVMLGADLKSVVAGFDDHTAKQVSNALVKVNTDVVKAKAGIATL